MSTSPAPESATPGVLITTYLHMTDRAQFSPAFIDDPAVQMITMQHVDLPYYKFLYTAVGDIWRWRDRIIMPESELQGLLEKPGTSVHVMFVDGVPAGYTELVKQGESTELAYVGLRPGFIGRGLGKHLLSFGIQRAWDDGAQRVWVHTCNLDAPSALPNYLARGFVTYQVTEEPMPMRYTT